MGEVAFIFPDPGGGYGGGYGGGSYGGGKGGGGTQTFPEWVC